LTKTSEARIEYYIAKMLSDFIQTSDINESYIFQETLGE
jgi:hypothetical protein